MTRRGWLLLTIPAAAALFVVAGIVAVAVSSARDAAASRDCAARAKAGEAKVRVDHQWTEHDLPGVGAYVDVHWQVRAAGDPCLRIPGPTDWHYQGLIRLRSQDAVALAHRFDDWRRVPTPASPSPDGYAFDTPTQMWPALVAFVPAGVRWLHSVSYAGTQFQHSRWGDLYLDPDKDVAFFVLYDH